VFEEAKEAEKCKPTVLMAQVTHLLVRAPPSPGGKNLKMTGIMVIG